MNFNLLTKSTLKASFLFLIFTTLFSIKSIADGCTDPNACNYDPSETVDDGSCLYETSCDDGDCATQDIYLPMLCTCVNIPLSDCDDGIPNNGIETWDPNLCECVSGSIVIGCTDPTACNYDSNASEDDGTCIQPPSFSLWYDNCFNSVALFGSDGTTHFDWVNLTTGQSGTAQANSSNNASIQISQLYEHFEIQVTVFINDCVGSTETIEDYTFPVDPPYIYNITQNVTCPNPDPIIISAFADGSSVQYEWYIDSPFEFISIGQDLIYDSSYGTTLLLAVYDQCGQVEYENYNVIIDDECVICEGPTIVHGCTDSSKCNYDPNATCDDGSCTDPPDTWINAFHFTHCDSARVIFSSNPAFVDATSFAWTNLSTGETGILDANSLGTATLFIYNDFSYDSLRVAVTPYVNDCAGETEVIVRVNREPVLPVVNGIWTSYSNCPGEGTTTIYADASISIGIYTGMLNYYWYPTNQPNNILSTQTYLNYNPSLGPQSFTFVIENICNGQIESLTSQIILDEALCINDGICENGIKIWNEENCNCDVIEPIYGCTDPSAVNYYALATCDNGSCGCPYNQTVEGIIPSGLYQASNRIISDGQVISGSNGEVIFNAGNYIDLNPGFESDATYQVTAEIINCTNNLKPLEDQK